MFGSGTDSKPLLQYDNLAHGHRACIRGRDTFIEIAALTSEEMIKRAVEHHQSGQLDEAERLYRQALDQSPNEADAWHLLGVLTGQRGNREGARQLVARAIEI